MFSQLDRQPPVFKVKSKYNQFLPDVTEFIVLSPNNKFYASLLSSRIIGLFDLRTHELITRLSETPDTITCCAIYESEQGLCIVAGSEDGTLRLWNPDKPAAPLAVWRGHDRRVTCCAVYVSGRDVIIVSGSADETLYLWNPDEPAAPLAVLRGHTSPLACCAVYDSGHGVRIVSGSNDGTLCLWNPAKSAAPFAVLRYHHTTSVTCCIVYKSRQGFRILSGSMDGRIFLWNPAALGAPFATLGGHTRGVTCGAAYVSGQDVIIVSGSRDGTLRLWNPDAPASPLAMWQGHTYGVACCTTYVSEQNGRIIISGSGNDGLRLWNPAALGTPLAVVGSHTIRVETCGAAYISKQGLRLVTGSWDGTLHIWNPAASNEQPMVWQGPQGLICCTVYVSAQGVQCLVLGYENGTLRLLNPDEPAAPSVVLRNYMRRVTCCTAYVSGRDVIIVSGSENLLRLWNLATPDEQPMVWQGPEGLTCCTVYDNGQVVRIVSGSGGRTLRLWNPATGQPAGIIGNPMQDPPSICKAVAHPDTQEQYLVLGNSRQITIGQINRGGHFTQMCAFDISSAPLDCFFFKNAANGKIYFMTLLDNGLLYSYHCNKDHCNKEGLQSLGQLALQAVLKNVNPFKQATGFEYQNFIKGIHESSGNIPSSSEKPRQLPYFINRITGIEKNYASAHPNDLICTVCGQLKFLCPH